MPAIWQREASPDDDAGDGLPPSPGSYFWPLLVITLLCAGFVCYRRKRRADPNFELRDVLKHLPRGLGGVIGRDDGIRLSVDDDPPRHVFLSNNASTDSLPADVELPTVSTRFINNNGNPDSGRGPAGDPLSVSQRFSDTPLQSKAAKLLGIPYGKQASAGTGKGARATGRRSMWRKRPAGPVEPDDEDEDEGGEEDSDWSGDDSSTLRAASRAEAANALTPFGIGDEEDMG